MTEDTPKRLVANDRTDRLAGLPFRGEFGAARPTALHALPLPPAPMPARLGTRPLKTWRYIGVFGPELMLCAATVRIGRARQSFWAAWDREGQRLHERTWLSKGGVQLSYGRALVSDGAARIDIVLAEGDGVETVCADGAGYAWTRKQGGVPATGTVVLGDGRARPIAAAAIIDDTAAYYRRHTRWRWCAGVGIAVDGRPVAWNLVEGVNDPPRDSERTLWVDGEPVRSAAGVHRPGAGPRGRPALRRRGHARPRPEPAGAAQPLPPALRHVLRHAPRWPHAWPPATA